MFVRKKKNTSGTISIQIISKYPKYHVVQTVGCSKNENEIKELVKKAQTLIDTNFNTQKQLDFGYSKKDKDVIESVVNAKVWTVGPSIVLGNIFDRIGFDKIGNHLFKKLAITRIVYPVSKLKTTKYLERHLNYHVSTQTIYNFLDKLHDTHKQEVEAIAYAHTKKILKQITVVFYDMTTLYFEIKEEDDLRKIGFSKDGKFQKPQIMLGLLVGENGYPIGYEIFQGNTFEGKTLLPMIDALQAKYGFSKPIIVADSGLLSKENVKELTEQDYEFIIGARIKNESDEMKDIILKKTSQLKDGQSVSILKDDLKLIVSYSEQRAKKDKYNRKKGLNKLRMKVKTGKLTKAQINNRGYNKFLKLENDVTVLIDEAKVIDDQKWDGLKGYLTNTTLSRDSVLNNYSQLWQIEKAFRISKNDLRIRPIFHFTQKRIKAHICLSFVAYTIYKEFERLLKQHEIDISVTDAIELLETIYEIDFVLPSGKREKRLINLNELQERLIWVSRF